MGIGGITPAMKLKMAAWVLRPHPVKNGGITLPQQMVARMRGTFRTFGGQNGCPCGTACSTWRRRKYGCRGLNGGI